MKFLTELLSMLLGRRAAVVQTPIFDPKQWVPMGGEAVSAALKGFPSSQLRAVVQILEGHAAEQQVRSQNSVICGTAQAAYYAGGAAVLAEILEEIEERRRDRD
jgi:hypothetical protein